jgi:crotonobetainyl-CoA:carnitine CoA-transferase CaiB-like acyl-CoA transferase
VIEFEGLAPSVHVGMVLKDLGAEILLIRNKNTVSINQEQSSLNIDKNIINLDLKETKDI